MNAIRSFTKISDRVLGVLTTILALILIVYSGYVLYDNFYRGQRAFSSWDLLQYKPTANDELSFDGLLDLNEDTVGWLTIDDTHIDYPVVRGKDNVEYANKDIYGQSSPSGAIYFDYQCDPDVTVNDYNMVYGHHMDNGAMFGDLDKYLDLSFFQTHQTGILQTPKQNYNLNLLAVLTTNAYDPMVFMLPKTHADFDVLSQYINNNAIYRCDFDYMSDKIVVLSTCYSGDTYGRLVVYFVATERTEPLPIDNIPAIHRSAIGHQLNNSGWSLLNVLCVGIILFTLIPFLYTKRKYAQYHYAKNIIDTLQQQIDGSEPPSGEGEGKSGEYSPEQILINDLKKFMRSMRIGTILEIILFVVSIVIFLVTESIFAPMIIYDKWTWLMIVLAIVGLVYDFVFFRYRGKQVADDLLPDGVNASG